MAVQSQVQTSLHLSSRPSQPHYYPSPPLNTIALLSLSFTCSLPSTLTHLILPYLSSSHQRKFHRRPQLCLAINRFLPSPSLRLHERESRGGLQRQEWRVCLLHGRVRGVVRSMVGFGFLFCWFEVCFWHMHISSILDTAIIMWDSWRWMRLCGDFAKETLRASRKKKSHGGTGPVVELFGFELDIWPASPYPPPVPPTPTTSTTNTNSD